jgi:hypothetical protein
VLQLTAGSRHARLVDVLTLGTTTFPSSDKLLSLSKTCPPINQQAHITNQYPIVAHDRTQDRGRVHCLPKRYQLDHRLINLQFPTGCCLSPTESPASLQYCLTGGTSAPPCQKASHTSRRYTDRREEGSPSALACRDESFARKHETTDRF